MSSGSVHSLSGGGKEPEIDQSPKLTTLNAVLSQDDMV